MSSISASEGSEHEGENDQTQHSHPAPDAEIADSPQVLWQKYENSNSNEWEILLRPQANTLESPEEEAALEVQSL